MNLPQSSFQASKVSPAFLFSNATAHTWPFSAVAELVDNAYDPDVGAKRINIDVEQHSDANCLVFENNGKGVPPNSITEMFGFGYSNKEQFNTASRKAIGRYGNGLKSGTMRLGTDALVLTHWVGEKSDLRYFSVGMLSKTFLEAINATEVLLPILTLEGNTYEPVFKVNRDLEQHNICLNAIITHSVFKSKRDLFSQFPKKPGTKIVIWNLRKDKESREEDNFTTSIETFDLEFDQNRYDIINRRASDTDLPYRRSLRSYLEILYLRPEMEICLRSHIISKINSIRRMRRVKKDTYAPRGNRGALMEITFGLVDKPAIDRGEYGAMIYNRKRLIEPYTPVGYCVRKDNDVPNKGVGVSVVVDVDDFLEPDHMKQNFKRDKAYERCMTSINIIARDYWDVDVNRQTTGENVEVDNWVSCQSCQKWRRVTSKVNENSDWFCSYNPDPNFNTCATPEEPEAVDTVAVTTNSVRKEKKRVLPTTPVPSKRNRIEQLQEENQQLKERQRKTKRTLVHGLKRATVPINAARLQVQRFNRLIERQNRMQAMEVESQPDSIDEYAHLLAGGSHQSGSDTPMTPTPQESDENLVRVSCAACTLPLMVCLQEGQLETDEWTCAMMPPEETYNPTCFSIEISDGRQAYVSGDDASPASADLTEVIDPNIPPRPLSPEFAETEPFDVSDTSARIKVENQDDDVLAVAENCGRTVAGLSEDVAKTMNFTFVKDEQLAFIYGENQRLKARSAQFAATLEDVEEELRLEREKLQVEQDKNQMAEDTIKFLKSKLVSAFKLLPIGLDRIINEETVMDALTHGVLDHLNEGNGQANGYGGAGNDDDGSVNGA